MPEPITVMIVDDHEMVRKGAKGYLEAQPEITVVAEAESGTEAVLLVREYVPDVVLMDLVMPGMDGVEATRRDSHRIQVGRSASAGCRDSFYDQINLACITNSQILFHDHSVNHITKIKVTSFRVNLRLASRAGC
jgi:CheY-like chemotaxis protein